MAWWVPALMMAGGAYLQHRGNEQRIEDRDKRISDALEYQRQEADKAYEKQDRMLSDLINDGGLKQDDLEKSMKDRASEVAKRIEENRLNPDGGPKYETNAIGSDAGNRAMNRSLESRRGELAERREQRSDADNRLSSLGSALQAGQIARMPVKERMGMEAANHQGTKELLPYQVQDAERKSWKAGQDLRTVGGMLQAGGSAYAMGM